MIGARAAQGLVIAAVVAACGEVERGAADAAGGDTTSVRVTWDEVAPVLARRCSGCHAEGGLAGIPLDSYEAARELGTVVLSAIESGVMPPWPPSEDCHPLAGARRVTADEAAIVRGWIAGGYAPGVDGAAGSGQGASAGTGTGFAPNETLTVSDAYVPNSAVEDDYHCFVVARDFAEDTYVTGSDVLPGSASVHHVLVYVIVPGQLAEVAARDAAHPGSGYPCLSQPVSTGFADQAAFIQYLAGGELPNFDFPDQIAAWVPGTVPRVLPAGTAYRVPAGARLVVQIHYNTTVDDGADTTRLALTTTREAPAWLLGTRPVAVQDLEIPAGAIGVEATRAFPYYAEEPLTIVGVMAHMHLLGRTFRAEVRPAAGAAQCLLDIAAWDFHWQEGYLFPADAPVTMELGEALALTCTYDNGASDQTPDASGVTPPPRDVVWGEGTRDEMCLFYYTSRRAFAPDVATAPASEVPCASAGACVEACRARGEASLGCVLGCAEARVSCQLCAVRAALRCSELACLSVLSEASDCMVTCLEATLMLGGNLGRCLEGECPDAYTSALACMDPMLARAECAGELAACGELK